jgi:integrase
MKRTVVKHTDTSRAEFFARANLTENTRRAYDSDLKQFREYGGKIPCDAQVLAEYVAHCAEWFSVATIERRLMAIRHAHAERGLPSPTHSPQVRAVMRGVRRQLGVAQRQAKPVTRVLLKKIVCAIGHSPIDRRDRALLLLGFAGGFRRSELVALDAEDLERTERGIVVWIRRSKTDQEQRGRSLAIPSTGGKLCAVTATERWLRSAEICTGPIFRRFDKNGELTHDRLAAAYVSQVLKGRLTSMGVDAQAYSAHSLRAGLITEAARAGVPSWKIRQQTGHRTETILARYIRDTEVWTNNAAGVVLGST